MMNGTVDIQNGVDLPDPTIDLHWDDYQGPITSFFDRNAKTYPDRICVIGMVPMDLLDTSRLIAV